MAIGADGSINAEPMIAAPQIRTTSSIPVSDVDLDIMVAAAQAAGHEVLKHFRPGEKTTARIDMKTGGSPVTQADLAANHLLRDHLSRAFPFAAWMSEEDPDHVGRLDYLDVLVIDPIDGTRAFIEGDPRFTISLALVRAGRPIAAVLHAPALLQTFTALAGKGASLNGTPLRLARLTDDQEIRAAGPKPMLDELAQSGLCILPQLRVPSLALRLAQVASGALQVAFAAGNSHDWDIAAADLIVWESGATLSSLTGEVPVYNLLDRVHGPLVAAAPGLHARLMQNAAK